MRELYELKIEVYIRGDFTNTREEFSVSGISQDDALDRGWDLVRSMIHDYDELISIHFDSVTYRNSIS